MTDLVMVGTGGFAREVLQVVLDINEASERWNLLGWLDDDIEQHGALIHDFPVLGGTDWMADRDGVQAVIAIGNTAVRQKIVSRLDQDGASRFATLVHPRAWIGRRVDLGEGTIVCAGTNITTDIRIGSHVILNLDCTVGHDTEIADFVTAAPSVNVSGNVRVGEGCDLGTGSVIIQGIDIGEWSILGAGAVVVKPLPANVTAVGAPAKVIKEREPGWHT